jgi:hypothetical protein
VYGGTGFTAITDAEVLYFLIASALTSVKKEGISSYKNSVATMPLLVHTNREQKLFEERLRGFFCL